jgi:hypothetical protein
MKDTKQLKLLVDVLEGAVSDSAKKTPQLSVRARCTVEHTFSFCLLSVGRFTALGDMMEPVSVQKREQVRRYVKYYWSPS